ncbi:MAG: ATP-binding protein [Gemmatimonadaceae bacterium]|jgi:signal transduction histidine kinase/CheY-like chemotaxis protein|nr:ATP-binding protein [Gemmatimonadaceae bacterium]
MLTRLRTSVAARLSLAVLGLGLGTVVLVSAVSYDRAEQALRERLLAELDADSRDNAIRVEEWLDRQRTALAVMASDLRQPPSAADQADVLAPLPPALLAADEVQLVRVPSGRIVRSSVPASVGTYAIDERYYEFGRGAPYIQPIYPNGRDGRPRLTVATPVRDRDGRTTGVLAAHLELAAMERVLRSLGETGERDAYLVNRFAEFVSAERFGREGVRRGVHSRAIDDAIAGGSGEGLYVNYAGIPVVGAWRWIPDLELALVLEVPQARAFAPARALLIQTLALGALASALLVLGTISIASRFTRPVLAVADAATTVAGGDFSVRAPVAGEDEVGRLAEAFNAMTSRLQSLYGALDEQVHATRDALVEAQESREMLRDVLDNASTLVLVIGLDSVVRMGNGRLAKLARRSVESLPGAPVAEVLAAAGAESIGTLIAQGRAADVPCSAEVVLAGPAGPQPWQVTVFPLRHDDGTPYATGVVGTDLTERARAEAERRAEDASVQQAQRLESLGVMAGGIAHDFNNLLGAILGNVELAADADDAPAERREALQHIAAAARRAAELTRQLLAYAGRASFRREVVDARGIVADLLPLVRAAQSKKVQFVIDPMPMPLWVELDPAQLSQVVLNLLTNAAEAIGDAPGTVRVHCADDAPAELPPGTPPDTRWLRLVVADTGTGMTAEVRDRIFDPFYTTKLSGRGLGLSAVRGIVRSLGGTLDVDSAPGAGTRFSIWLPAAAPPADARPEPTSAAAARLRGTVLVVDDEAAIRRVVRRIVERLGFDVLEAVDGDDAAERLARHADALALVVLDLTMPGRSGAELLRDIRQVRPTLPVLVASGYDAADAMRGLGEDAHTRFLQKPFSTKGLERLVGELMAFGD